DIGEGALAVALAESLIGANGLGAEAQIAADATTALFSESQSRFSLTVKAEDIEQFEALHLDATKLGVVTYKQVLSIKNAQEEMLVEEQVDQLRTLWSNRIAQLLKSN